MVAVRVGITIVIIMLALVMALVTLTWVKVAKLEDKVQDHHYELTHGFYKDILDDSRKTVGHAEKVLDLNSEIVTNTSDVISRLETSNDLLQELINSIKLVPVLRREIEEE
jgi:hypothetical protein